VVIEWDNRNPVTSSPPSASQNSLNTTSFSVLGLALRKFKSNTSTCQPSVDLGVGIESVVHATSLLLVKNNLQGLGTIFLRSDALSDDLNRVDEVGEDSIMNSGECSGTRTLLGLRGTGAVGSLGAGKDTARREDQDVTIRELLLEFTGETIITVRTVCSVPKPKTAYRCWTLWKPGRRGTGTKMTMAFFPWPASIYMTLC
jgi:hypothetical protein